ncbi:MAG: ASPIC/UnbV domain-containing protein [Acidobacteriota bacterium]
MASKKTASGERERDAKGFLGRQLELFKAGFSFSGYERDMLAMNLGDGHFLDVSGVSGADSVSDGRAAVFGDFDNDGDTDIFLRAMHGRAHFLFRNDVGQDASSLRISLRAHGARDAFGAVVRVATPSGTLTKVKSGGSGFLAEADPRLLFGLGDAREAAGIEVTWPGGRKQSFGPVPAGASILLVEGEPGVQHFPERRFKLPDPVSLARKSLTAGKDGRLPAVEVQDLAGRPLSLAVAGKGAGFTLVNFWATWCGPCAAEMPDLQEIWEGRRGNSLAILGVSLDAPGDRKKVPPFLKRLGVTYPVYTLDPDGVAALFSTRDVPIPLSVLLDGDSRIVQVFQGWSKATRRRLEALSRGEASNSMRP